MSATQIIYVGFTTMLMPTIALVASTAHMLDWFVTGVGAMVWLVGAFMVVWGAFDMGKEKHPVDQVWEPKNNVKKS